MKRSGLLFLLAALAAVTVSGEEVTLPAVASIVGGAPFFSDVRVFNTSYESTVSITATYRCFIGACSGGAQPIDITLPPRQSVAFNDIVANAFAAPNSAGAVELEVTAGGTAADVGVTLTWLALAAATQNPSGADVLRS